MRKKVLPVLLALLCTTAQAIEFPVEVIETIDSNRVVAFINEADIDASAEWTPFQGNPSLDVAGALKALHQVIDGDPQLAAAQLVDIELRRIPRHETRWHYLVRMKSVSNETPVSHFFIVLMNGKVLQGVREPQAVK